MNINALVVDDSGIMRKLVMRSLKEAELASFIFTEAKDGMEGLEKFDPDKTDMMFVDWNMPNMNGIDFIKKVREAQKRYVPAVMITTESTMEKVEEALNEAGVDTFIVKPFTVDVLKSKLEPLFDKIAAAQQNGGGFFSKLANKLN